MKTAILILFVLNLNQAMADEETRAAVSSVQEEIQNPDFHEQAAKTNPDAREIAKQIKEMSGTPANEQEVYNLASDILGNMKDSPPEEMKTKLQDAQDHPEGFANTWTPAQKRKLEELAKRLPASQKQKP